MRKWIAAYLCRRARRTPYYHLTREDGTVYMERYWLVPYRFLVEIPFWGHPIGWLLQRFDIAVRIHHIMSPDLDRVMHDHPWDFISVPLAGFYVEKRPAEIAPCFSGDNDHENGTYTIRREWQWAFRRATDRHRIVEVSDGGVVTLFITFKKRQWWGFYTRTGKIYYRDYESVHSRPLSGADIERRVEKVCADADAAGFVVTVEQEPLQPLAMGHYRSKVEARVSRGIYNAE